MQEQDISDGLMLLFIDMQLEPDQEVHSSK